MTDKTESTLPPTTPRLRYRPRIAFIAASAIAILVASIFFGILAAFAIHSGPVGRDPQGDIGANRAASPTRCAARRSRRDRGAA